MHFKWIGAMLIIAGCGGTGFSMALSYKREENQLKEFLTALQTMENDLEFLLTPLPELIKHILNDTTGSLRYVMEDFLKELTRQEEPDAQRCMSYAIRRNTGLSPQMSVLLKQLGRTLGKFDLEAQLRNLRCLQASCQEELKKLKTIQDVRLRSYQTLGLCAGAALAILFA